MKKTLFTIVLMVSVILSVKAQSPAKAVFFELGGPGLASVNYDMRFTKSEKGIGGRIGVGGFSIGQDGNSATVVFLPVGLNYILGKDERHYFEIGAGVTPVKAKEPFTDKHEKFQTTFGHLDLGYRLQPKDGGFFFRAAITPLFGKNFFWPYYGGVSFGYKL